MFDQLFQGIAILFCWLAVIVGLAVALVLCGLLLECGAQLIR